MGNCSNDTTTLWQPLNLEPLNFFSVLRPAVLFQMQDDRHFAFVTFSRLMHARRLEVLAAASICTALRKTGQTGPGNCDVLWFPVLSVRSCAYQKCPRSRSISEQKLYGSAFCPFIVQGFSSPSYSMHRFHSVSGAFPGGE